MNLDCIEEEDGRWQVIDLDNSCKQISVADDVDGAWYKAASVLQFMINQARKELDA